MLKLIFSLIICTFLFSCGVSKKEIKDISQSLCECFDGYAQTNRDKMEQTISCLNKLRERSVVTSISQHKLIKQLQKDCPEAKKKIVELLQL